MNPIIIYTLKVNIAIALFYLFYRLFFAGDTLWKTRRFYLIFGIFISFIYPFFSIIQWMEQSQPMQQIIGSYVMLQEFTVTPEQQISFSAENLFFGIYGIVVGALLLKLMIQIISIVSIKRKGKKQLVQGVEVIAIEEKIAPFSFFSQIFINPSLHNEHETKEILAHELTHVVQLHSLDVMLAEFVTILCWFNPAIWLIKREIRQNLEFLADNKVLVSGFDSKSYQYHLLLLSYHTPDLKLTNRFNISPLKKRITMMNQQKTSKAAVLKYLLIVPLGLALIVSSNAETLISTAKKTLQEKTTASIVQDEPQSKTVNTSSKMDEVVVVGYGIQGSLLKATPPPPPAKSIIKEVKVVGYAADQEKSKDAVSPSEQPSDDVVFMVVEKMPQYPGGDSELFKYLANNIKYPVEAQKAGIQGRVICQFVVRKDGTISDIEVIRSVDPKLDAEAIRVVQSMSTWTPGEQRGKKVNVKYTLPINFALQGKSIEVKSPGIIVVDGEIKTGEYMSTLKESDIEKFEVLKGNTEEEKNTLIKKYGDQAVNGVLLITTKK